MIDLKNRKHILKIPGDFTLRSIAKSGPIVAGTRKMKFNPKTKMFDLGKVHGFITNYDGRVTKFRGEEDRKKKSELEWARWHYWKSFEPYGFSAKEWK